MCLCHYEFRFLSWKQYIAGFLKLHSESYSVLIGELNVYIYCEYMCMCFCIHTHTYTCIFIVYHVLYSYAFYTCLPPFFWSVQFSHSVVYDSLQPLQHAQLPCPLPTPRAVKLMSIESVMPSNHLILCCSLLLLPSVFPSIRVFSSESALASGSQRIGGSAPALALPMNFQDCILCLAF